MVLDGGVVVVSKIEPQRTTLSQIYSTDFSAGASSASAENGAMGQPRVQKLLRSPGRALRLGVRQYRQVDPRGAGTHAQWDAGTS